MGVAFAVRAIGIMLVRLGLQVLRGTRRRLGGAHQGQSLVEYAIVVALVAIVSMVAVAVLGESIARIFQHIVAQLEGVGG